MALIVPQQSSFLPIIIVAPDAHRRYRENMFYPQLCIARRDAIIFLLIFSVACAYEEYILYRFKNSIPYFGRFECISIAKNKSITKI
jgi:hypothetical protein